MTNADKIRNMSNEELAELLIKAENAGYNDSSITPKDAGNYPMDMLKWLESETSDNSNYTNGLLSAIDIVNQQPKIGEWIPCSERLPEEHKSIFAKLKGTDKWSNAMFEKTSSEVNATIEFEDGKRAVKALHTIDGRWNEGNRGLKFKVIAWKPFPEPYTGNYQES